MRWKPVEAPPAYGAPALSPPSDEQTDTSAWRTVGPADRRVPWFHGLDLILILALTLTGLFLVSTLFTGPADPDQEFPDQDPSVVRGLVHFSNFLSFMLFGGLPFIWLLSTRVVPLQGALMWLGFWGDGKRTWPFWFGIASLLTVALIGAVIGFGYLIEALGTEQGDPTFMWILENADWFVIIGISLSAGIGEEVMFRGVLQKKLGWAGQAVLFGAAHVNQGFLAAAFITGLAMVFGYLVKRGAPLWAVMFTHVMYDFILLAAGKLDT